MAYALVGKSALMGKSSRAHRLSQFARLVAHQARRTQRSVDRCIPLAERHACLRCVEPLHRLLERQLFVLGLGEPRESGAHAFRQQRDIAREAGAAPMA